MCMTRSKILLPGTFNSRDLGGSEVERGVVRHGLVVRSDAPVRLGEEGRAALRSLGIRRAVVLREPVERELDPVDFAGLGIEVVHQSILGGDFAVRTEMT